MTTEPGSPADRLLTASLVAAPFIYLIADLIYALRGWDDPAGGVVHVLGAVAYGLLALRLVTWSRGRLAAALLLVGAIGTAGNVAYGFEAIHLSLGDTALVDQPGAANLIKPLGLFFPLTLLLAAGVVRRVGGTLAAGALVAAAVAWPVAHIANIGWLAVATDVVLVGVFAACAVATVGPRGRDAHRPADAEPGSVMTPSR